MPFPIAAAITGGAALAGGLANSFSQANLNKKNRRWSEQMYQRQYADNLAFWAMQNEYNSPQAQMRRFQEAGLNPNLIYGQGNSGNAGAVQTPDIQGTDQRSPEWGNAFQGPADGIASFYDTQIKQATVDNLKEQNTVIRQDAYLKEAQTLSTIAGTDATKFDLSQRQRLADISAQAAAENLRQTKVSTDLAINRDAREALRTTSDLAEAAERMMSIRLGRAKTQAEISHIKQQNAQIKEQISLMKQDGTLKRLEINLREEGINPHDPMYMRIIGQALDGMTKDPVNFQKKLRNMISNLWDSVW